MSEIDDLTELLNKAYDWVDQDMAEIQVLNETIATQSKALDILEQIVETQRKTIDMQQESINKLKEWAAEMANYIDTLEAHLEQTLSAQIMHTSN